MVEYTPKNLVPILNRPLSLCAWSIANGSIIGLKTLRAMAAKSGPAAVDGAVPRDPKFTP